MTAQLDAQARGRLFQLAAEARALPRHTEDRLIAEVAFEDAMLPFMTDEQQADWSNYCFNVFDGDLCIDKALQMLDII